MGVDMWNYLPGSRPESFEEFRDFIVKTNSGEDAVIFAVFDKTRPSEPSFAGIVIYANASPQNLSIEIGILILPDFHRSHVTSNAIGIFLYNALDVDRGWGMRRVYWTAASGNTKSIAAAERMGFVKEGIMRWALVFPECKRKFGNGRSGPDHDQRPGRDSVLLSICWDDWQNGAKERVEAAINRKI